MKNPTHVSWTGSNEREDGTPYLPTDRRGYNVFIFPAGGSPEDVTFTAIGEAYDFSMPIADMGDPLTDGAYQMIITDVDTDGRESGYSLPIDITIDTVALPKPVTGVLAFVE